MPDNIRLADAMRTLTVTINDDGYELESTAGKAFYNAWGTRGKVEGIPEYFPVSLNVNNPGKPAQSVTLSGQIVSSTGNAASAPYEVELCGNTIEQETLSAVLVHYLPNTVMDKASENAVTLASAVKASFAELGRSTGGFVIARDGVAHIIGEKNSETTIPAQSLKPSADGEEKKTSAFTVKINVDTSEAMKSLDKLDSAMAKKIDAILAKALQPGDGHFSALKQRGRDAEYCDLALRIRQLESCINKHSAEISGLNTRLLSFSSGR